MYNGLIIYWVMVNGVTMLRTQRKHHAYLTAYVYAKENPEAYVKIVACNDHCVPTLDNRVWDECAYNLSREELWEIAETWRTA